LCCTGGKGLPTGQFTANGRYFQRRTWLAPTALSHVSLGHRPKKSIGVRQSAESASQFSAIIKRTGAKNEWRFQRYFVFRVDESWGVCPRL